MNYLPPTEDQRQLAKIFMEDLGEQIAERTEILHTTIIDFRDFCNERAIELDSLRYTESCSEEQEEEFAFQAWMEHLFQAKLKEMENEYALQISEKGKTKNGNLGKQPAEMG